MAITDLPLFAVLRTKMKWHQARQRMLAQNVANADTPGYHGHDLKPLDFRHGTALRAPSGVTAMRTHPNHVAGHAISERLPFDTDKATKFETPPNSNTVVLEEEMMKVTANQLDYQTVSALYGRGLGMLKTALGRRA